jgi:nitroreductase
MEPIENVWELFPRQRAVRAFTDQDVGDDLVQRVLEAATRAPSGSNTQPWRFIVVRDPQVKAQLGEAYEEGFRAAYGDQAPARGANRQPWTQVPVLIIACVQVPGNGRAGFQTGASIYPAVQNLMLAARALGLGTVLTTLHRRRIERIHEILGIPETYDSAAIIPLGWPAERLGKSRRRPLEEVTMRDRWDPAKA